MLSKCFLFSRKRLCSFLRHECQHCCTTSFCSQREWMKTIALHMQREIVYLQKCVIERDLAAWLNLIILMDATSSKRHVPQ